MRLLHTMLRVGDLERSLAFYTEMLRSLVGSEMCIRDSLHNDPAR